MSLSDELRKLQELHDSGALTAEEFAQFKQAVLAKDATWGQTASQTYLQRLEEVELQTQLLKIDQDWETERKAYMIQTRYGSNIPTKEGSLLGGGMIAGVFSLLVIFFSSSSRPPHPIVVVSMITGVVAGLLLVGIGYLTATKYDRAYQNYQENRRRAIERHRNRRNRA